MRMRLFIVLAVSLWCGMADAATYYVRPIAGSYGAENGTSYATAFKGFADVSGLAAGDTLYICGAHTEKFTTPISGTSVAQMVADGACPGDPGSITIGSGANAAIAQVFGQGESYWTFQNLTLSGGTTAAVYCNGNDPNCIGNIYQDLTIACTQAGQTKSGIRLRSAQSSTVRRVTMTGNDGACGFGILVDTTETGDSALTGNLVTGNTISGFGNPGIRFAGVSIASPLPGPNTVTYNDVSDSGDGIYHVNANSITTSYNTLHGNARTNYAGEGYGAASTWCDLGVWEGNEIYENRWKGIEIYTDSDRAALTGVTIQGNYIHENNTAGDTFRCAIDLNNGSPDVGGVLLTNGLVRANVTVGSTCGVNIGKNITAAVVHNTLINPTAESAIFLESGSSNVTVVNNLLVPGSATYGLWQSISAGSNNTIRNNFFDTATTANLARVESTNYTSGTITTVDAQAVMGAAGVASATDYRLSLTSPARAAGRSTGICLDYRGRVCPSTRPHIGAYQSSSGDPAATRAVRN